MDESLPLASVDLTAKIARLVQERGWNQEDFARIANLNRQTARQILLDNSGRRLRNATISSCARALGLTVSDLRDVPLERLLPRMHSSSGDTGQRRLFEEATQPELLAWLQRNPDRAARLTPEDRDELLSLQGTGGPLTNFGVEHFVEQIERKRRLLQMVAAVAGTEYLDVLEKIVALMHEKIQPYRGR